MILGNNLRIAVIMCLFLGANWILIDLLPYEIIHAHVAPTSQSAPHVRNRAGAAAAELSPLGVFGIYH